MCLLIGNASEVRDVAHGLLDLSFIPFPLKLCDPVLISVLVLYVEEPKVNIYVYIMF